MYAWRHLHISFLRLAQDFAQPVGPFDLKNKQKRRTRRHIGLTQTTTSSITTTTTTSTTYYLLRLARQLSQPIGALAL